jgi:hypothetical protein
MRFWLPTPRFAAFLAAAAGISLTASERAPSAEFRALTPPQVTLGRVVEGPRVDACELRRRAVALEPALPGAPGVEAARGELLARARAEPVLFLDAPRAPESSPVIAALRARLFGDPAPWTAFAEVFERFRGHPLELRQILLTEGYLYAEQPTVAALLVSAVALPQLFSEKELVVVRGDRTLRAERVRGEYVWADGPEHGERARLWLFDRVSLPSEKLSPSKHVAVADLRLGTSSIEIERLTERAALAQLRYAQLSVPAVLALREGRLVLECESLSPAARPQVEAARSAAQRRGRVLGELWARVAEQVEEALPFDEPKTEDGQQDGKLRPEWRSAYLRGASSFEFNGDRYPVFDQGGRPRPPQVCVDFIVDTWERMAGTHWLGRDEGRARRLGRLDFGELGIENRRSVEQLIEFTRSRADWFELLEIPEAERVPFSGRQRFFQRLFERRQEFRPGDVVAILGPRDDERLHYHSFFIVADDPLIGMPTLVAANAGRPRIRNWETELQSAPRRSIVARIRPRLGWLESLVGIFGQAQAGPDRVVLPPG